MRNTNKIKNYEKLSFVYSHIMRSVNYKRWALYLRDISKKYLIKNPNTLELAAGNCSLAGNMIKYFPNLIATDLSFEMLTNSEYNSFPKVCCSMTYIPFNNKFEFIYSTFDSVNYLLSKEKLKKLFINVYDILSDDGLFTFDASLENNSIKHANQTWRKEKYKEIQYKHKSEYNEKTKIHKNIFQLILPDKSVYFEIHKQKVYPFEVYFDLLEKSNLYVVECLETFSFLQGKPESDRVQFLVKKVK